LIIISKNLHSALFHQTLNNIFYITEKQNKQKIKKSFKDEFSWNLCKFIDIIKSEYTEKTLISIWIILVLIKLFCTNFMS
jgi:hypothetical protein